MRDAGRGRNVGSASGALAHIRNHLTTPIRAEMRVNLVFLMRVSWSGKTSIFVPHIRKIETRVSHHLPDEFLFFLCVHFFAPVAFFCLSAHPHKKNKNLLFFLLFFPNCSFRV